MTSALTLQHHHSWKRHSTETYLHNVKKCVFKGALDFGNLGSGVAGVDDEVPPKKRTVQMTPVKFRALPFKLRTVERGWSCTSWPSSSSSSISSCSQHPRAGPEAEDMRTADTNGFDETQEGMMWTKWRVLADRKVENNLKKKVNIVKWETLNSVPCMTVIEYKFCKMLRYLHFIFHFKLLSTSTALHLYLFSRM